jgi:CcmD family protein
MGYFCAAFSFLWVMVLGYVIYLERQVKDLSRRLEARSSQE